MRRESTPNVHLYVGEYFTMLDTPFTPSSRQVHVHSKNGKPSNYENFSFKPGASIGAQDTCLICTVVNSSGLPVKPLRMYRVLRQSRSDGFRNGRSVIRLLGEQPSSSRNEFDSISSLIFHSVVGTIVCLSL